MWEYKHSSPPTWSPASVGGKLDKLRPHTGHITLSVLPKFWVHHRGGPRSVERPPHRSKVHGPTQEETVTHPSSMSVWRCLTCLAELEQIRQSPNRLPKDELILMDMSLSALVKCTHVKCSFNLIALHYSRKTDTYSGYDSSMLKHAVCAWVNQ